MGSRVKHQPRSAKSLAQAASRTQQQMPHDKTAGRQASAQRMLQSGVPVDHAKAACAPGARLADGCLAFMALDLDALPKDLSQALKEVRDWLPHAGESVRKKVSSWNNRIYNNAPKTIKLLDAQQKGGTLPPGLTWAKTIVQAHAKCDWQDLNKVLHGQGLHHLPPPSTDRLVPADTVRAAQAAPGRAAVRQAPMEERFIARDNLGDRRIRTAEKIKELDRLLAQYAGKTTAPARTAALSEVRHPIAKVAAPLEPLWTEDELALPKMERSPAERQADIDKSVKELLKLVAEVKTTSAPAPLYGNVPAAPARTRHVAQGLGPKPQASFTLEKFPSMKADEFPKAHKDDLVKLHDWVSSLAKYGVDERNKDADLDVCDALRAGIKKGSLPKAYESLLQLTDEMRKATQGAENLFERAFPPKFPAQSELDDRLARLQSRQKKLGSFPEPGTVASEIKTESTRLRLLAAARHVFDMNGPDEKKFVITDFQIEANRYVISYQSSRGVNKLKVARNRDGKLRFLPPIKGRLAAMGKVKRNNILEKIEQVIGGASAAYQATSDSGEVITKRMFEALNMASTLVTKIPRNGFQSFFRNDVQDSKYRLDHQELKKRGLDNDTFKQWYRGGKISELEQVEDGQAVKEILAALMVEVTNDMASLLKGRFEFKKMSGFFALFASNGSWKDLPADKVKQIQDELNDLGADKETVYLVFKGLNLFRDQILAHSKDLPMRKLGANFYQLVQGIFGFDRNRSDVEKVWLAEGKVKGINEVALSRSLMEMNRDAMRAGFELVNDPDFWFGMQLD